MNKLSNKVQLIGNLGAKPEVLTFDGGRKKVNARMATSEVYKDATGKKVTETQWHNIVAWGNTAEVFERYLDKGSKIAVEGRLVHRSYDDKEGNRKYISEVVVNELLMMDTKNRDSE